MATLLSISAPVNSRSHISMCAGQDRSVQNSQTDVPLVLTSDMIESQPVPKPKRMMFSHSNNLRMFVASADPLHIHEEAVPAAYER